MRVLGEGVGWVPPLRRGCIAAKVGWCRGGLGFGGDGRERCAFALAHLSDGEAVAKMGHPVFGGSLGWVGGGGEWPFGVSFFLLGMSF